MSLIKEEAGQYVALFGLKSKIKDEECQEKILRSDLEKVQREELNESIDNIDWKIKRAEFILECEKKRHDFFYGIIEKAEDSILKDDLFVQYKKFGIDMHNYRVRLEEEKTSLIKQLEELKE